LRCTVSYTCGMPIGPSCAVAEVTPAGARIFSNSQDAYGTAQLVKNVLDKVMGSSALPLNRIRVTYYEGASSFGARATTNDASQGAAIMSALVGKPVRLQFMRWDEHGWNTHWPAFMFDIRSGIDRKGNLVGIEHTDFLIPHSLTRAAEQQVTGKAEFVPPYQPAVTSSGLQYGLANRKAIAKTLPLLNNYFQTWYTRAPYRVEATFAAEQAFDELAHAAGMDPVAFRLQNVATTATDPHQRWRNVLTNVAALANWQPKVAASKLSTADVVTGRGISFGFDHGTVVAAVADIEVNKKTGKVVAKQIYSAVEPGVVINPGGIENNLSGDVIMATSRVLIEQVPFDKRGITGLDWVTYPILRFKDSPKVTIKLLSRSDVPSADPWNPGIPDPAGGSSSGGGGEATSSAVGAAIANAFFDATGVRMRTAPMTPARVRATLKAAGMA
jgi:nicotinate dehydrogenase subunit B